MAASNFTFSGLPLGLAFGVASALPAFFASAWHELTLEKHRQMDMVNPDESINALYVIKCFEQIWNYIYITYIYIVIIYCIYVPGWPFALQKSNLPRFRTRLLENDSKIANGTGFWAIVSAFEIRTAFAVAKKKLTQRAIRAQLERNFYQAVQSNTGPQIKTSFFLDGSATFRQR